MCVYMYICEDPYAVLFSNMYIPAMGKMAFPGLIALGMLLLLLLFFLSVISFY